MPQLDPFKLTRLIELGTLEEIKQYVVMRRLEMKGGMSAMRAVADSLGYHDDTVRQWVKDFDLQAKAQAGREIRS